MRKEEQDLNRELIEYENLEKQLEVLLIQKHQLQIQSNEVKHATEELKKADGNIYRSIGSIMMQSSKGDAEKELNERSELIKVKLGALEKQEEKLRGIVMDRQKKIQESLKSHEKK
ncbi:MAG: prefoldin subunit [Candidatus Micrarchaeota archaeon]